MVKNQDLVDKIDPMLIFKKNLMKYVSRPIYQVERNRTLYVLKVFDNGKEWERKHIIRENEVLQIVQQKIKGITHIIHDYGIINKYIAILKEFAEGEDLEQLGGALNNTLLQTQLEETVRGLHKLGVANIDIYPKNIVIAPNEEYAKIIDLGYCSLRDNVSIEKFERFKSNDLYSLERLSIPNSSDRTEKMNMQPQYNSCSHNTINLLEKLFATSFSKYL